MGMIVKSLLAGIVLAGMAGGGVYYGLSPVEKTAKVEQPVKPISPKTVTVKKVADAGEHPHPERKKSSQSAPEKAGKSSDNPDTKKSWMDQYINKSSESENPATGTKSSPPRDGLESKMNPDATSVDKEARAKAQEMKALARAERKKARAERKIMMAEKASKEAKGKFIVKDEKSSSKKPSSAIGPQVSYDTLEIIMREAAQIESTDLRDRAYLSAVDFALSHKYFGKAKEALEEISQPELRETARSRIGVHYAGSGNPEAAFDLVDSVEISDFKDAMRIQIIEALIAAESNKHPGRLRK